MKYCCQIWSQYKKGTVRKLQVGYNHAFRRIMKYDRTCSASGMFVANNVMSFNEIWRKGVYNFKQRVTKSNNIIVNHVYNFTRATSTIWKKFDRILCKYVIVVWVGAYRSYTPTYYYVLLYYYFYTTMSECMIFLWAYSAWNKLFYSILFYSILQHLFEGIIVLLGVRLITDIMRGTRCVWNN